MIRFSWRGSRGKTRILNVVPSTHSSSAGSCLDAADLDLTLSDEDTGPLLPGAHGQLRPQGRDLALGCLHDERRLLAALAWCHIDEHLALDQGEPACLIEPDRAVLIERH